MHGYIFLKSVRMWSGFFVTFVLQTQTQNFRSRKTEFHFTRRNSVESSFLVGGQIAILLDITLLFVRYCQSFAREIDPGFLQIFQEPKTSQWCYFPHINEMRRFLFTQYTVILTLFSSSGISIEDRYLNFLLESSLMFHWNKPRERAHFI